MSEILLILYGLLQCSHDLQLFQGEYTQAFDEASKSVCCPLPLAIVLRLQEKRQETLDYCGSVRFNGWYQWRQTVGYCFLYLSESRVILRRICSDMGLRLEKMRNFPGIWSKIASKMSIFYKFSEFVGRKRSKYPSK